MITAKDDSQGLSLAANILNRGGVAVVPTDTVYGLAAHPDFPASIERIYSIKHREPKKPIAFLACSAEAVAKAGFALSGAAADLARLNWPGALTLVLEKDDGTCEAFRVPDHVWMRKLLAECGGLLKVTSANISGEVPATTFAQALESVASGADIAIDGGTIEASGASAVVKALESGEIEILRPNPLLKYGMRDEG